MNESHPLSGLPGVNPLENAQSSSGAKQAKSGSPAFHVLLERLQSQASELEETSRTLDDPAGLAGAVDVARASFDDAVSLSDRLLEAFREAQAQSATDGQSAASDEELA